MISVFDATLALSIRHISHYLLVTDIYLQLDNGRFNLEYHTPGNLIQNEALELS